MTGTLERELIEALIRARRALMLYATIKSALVEDEIKRIDRALEKSSIYRSAAKADA